MKIGIAGTGRMGAALAGRLAGLGHEVAVWNRTAAKARSLGFPVLETPKQLIANSQAVITMLAHGEAVKEVYAQLLAGHVQGRLFIDMSTVRPEVSREISSRVRGKSAFFVECPVGGSVGPAKEGKLFGFAGGEAADVERARPLLAQMCRRIEHVGPAGAGASLKLAINLPLLVYWQALGEALALMKPLKLDPKRIIDILSDTSGGPNVLKVRGPALAAAMSGKDVTPVTFDVDSIRKDLRTMIEEGKALGLDLPVTECALASFDAVANEGLGAKDASALPARYMRDR